MKKKNIYTPLLLGASMTFSCATLADMFYVESIVVKRGEISEQPLNVLQDKAQSGSSNESNNWNTYVEVSPNNNSFIGNFKFTVDTDMSWDKLVVHSNTLGAAFDEQQWSIQLKNFKKGGWDTIGSNQDALNWVWFEQSVSVDNNIEDYIKSSNGRVNVRMRSNNNSDVRNVDFLALELISSDTVTPTPVTTPTPTPVTTPTPTPVTTPTPTPVATPTPTPVATPTPTPVVTPTPTPVTTPTPTPVATPTPTPVATPTPSANIITVGKSGSEDYTTIQAALDAVDTVDTTVLVKAGTYNETLEFNTCGSEDGYIVVQGEEGAVMSGSSGDAFYLEDCSYVKIRGFEITGFDQGIEVAQNSDYIYIENNYLHHIGDNKNSLVVYVHGSSNEKDPNEQIFILNNEMSYNTPGNSEVLTVNGNVDGFVIQGNYIHHNNNIGIDAIGFEGNGPDGLDQARNGLIADNRVEYISSEGGPGFDRNPTYPKNDYSADCIYVDGGKNIIIERNIVSNCDLGIELASEHKGENTENIIVRNNFVSNSYQGNITMGGYASNKGNAINIQVYNNTTYNGNDAEILVQHNTSNVTIKNNILYAKSGNDYLSNNGSNNSNFTVTNNIYYGASRSSEGSWTDTNPLFVDPLLSDISNNDLHIDLGSPAFDAGAAIEGNDFLGLPLVGSDDIDGDVRVNESVDIGADEL